MDALHLDARAGLPDALRVLMADYPRAAWEAHPEFSALIRFWLDRHLMFRRLQAMLRGETQTYLDGGMEARRYGSVMARLAQRLVGDLHEHHHIEDVHFFPVLGAQEARLATGFDLLEADHQAIDPALEVLVAQGNGILRDLSAERPDRRLAEGFLGAVATLDRLLDRHLVDEEELVVPVLLKYRGAGLS